MNTERNAERLSGSSGQQSERRYSMKKKIAAIALVLTLATVGMASARGGMGGGYGGCYHHPQMQGQMLV
jgi:hypothetical protein